MTETPSSTRRVRLADSLHRMAFMGVCISMLPFVMTIVVESGTLADVSYAYVTVSPMVWFGMFLVGIVLGGPGPMEKWAGALSILYLFTSFLSVRIG